MIFVLLILIKKKGGLNNGGGDTISLNDSFVIASQVCFILALTLPWVIVLFGYIVKARKIGADRPRYASMVRLFWNLGDFYSDAIFATVLLVSGHDLAWAAVFFTLVPHVFSNIICLYRLFFWRDHDIYITKYIDKYDWFIIFLSVFAGFYSAIEIAQSRFFYFPIFGLQIRVKENASTKTWRFFNNVLFENAPQLIVQILYAATTELNFIVFSTMLFSTLSLVVGILQQFSRWSRKYKSDAIAHYYLKLKLISKDIQSHHQYTHYLLGLSLANTMGVPNDTIEVYYIFRTHNGLRALVEVFDYGESLAALDKLCGKENPSGAEGLPQPKGQGQGQNKQTNDKKGGSRRGSRFRKSSVATETAEHGDEIDPKEEGTVKVLKKEICRHFRLSDESGIDIDIEFSDRDDTSKVVLRMTTVMSQSAMSVSGNGNGTVNQDNNGAAEQDALPNAVPAMPAVYSNSQMSQMSQSQMSHFDSRISQPISIHGSEQLVDRTSNISNMSHMNNMGIMGNLGGMNGVNISPVHVPVPVPVPVPIAVPMTISEQPARGHADSVQQMPSLPDSNPMAKQVPQVLRSGHVGNIPQAFQPQFGVNAMNMNQYGIGNVNNNVNNVAQMQAHASLNNYGSGHGYSGDNNGHLGSNNDNYGGNDAPGRKSNVVTVMNHQQSDSTDDDSTSSSSVGFVKLT